MGRLLKDRDSPPHGSGRPVSLKEWRVLMAMTTINIMLTLGLIVYLVGAFRGWWQP